MGKTFWGAGEPSTGNDSGNFCGRIVLNDSRYPIKENWTSGNCVSHNSYTGFICSSKVSENFFNLKLNQLGQTWLLWKQWRQFKFFSTNQLNTFVSRSFTKHLFVVTTNKFLMLSVCCKFILL